MLVEIGLFPLVCGWWLDVCSLVSSDSCTIKIPFIGHTAHTVSINFIAHSCRIVHLHQAPVVQRSDNFIQQITLYSADKMYWLEYILSTEALGLVCCAVSDEYILTPSFHVFAVSFWSHSEGQAYKC